MARVRWVCPQCGQKYAIPGTANIAKLTICPKCQAVEQQPIIDVPTNVKNVYWTKSGTTGALLKKLIPYIGSFFAVIYFAFAAVVYLDTRYDPYEKMKLIITFPFSILILFALAIGFFLPSIIAYTRAHRNFIPILILNVTFAWTGIVWIGLMVWATISTVKVETERII